MDDINQDKKFCEWCGKEQGSEKHHMFTRGSAPQVKDDPRVLVLLCHGCHYFATTVPEFAELLIKTFFLQERPEKLNMEYIAKSLSTRKFFAPGEIVSFRNYLAGEYYFWSTLYADAEMEKAQLMVKERPNRKSKTDTEDYINTLDCGKNVIKCHRLLNAIEQLQSALFTQHRQLESESRLST